MSNSLLNTLPADKTVRMNSKEISELVGKRHDNVKRTIETVAEQGVIVLPQIEVVPFVDESGRNRTVEAFIFSGEQGFRDSLVVVAQLSSAFTGALVDRWKELEEQTRTGVKTYAEFQKAYWLHRRKDAARYYTSLMEVLEEKFLAEGHDLEAIVSIKKREAEFINRMTHALESYQFRIWFDVRRAEPIRDHMPDRLLEAISMVEQQNIVLILADVPQESRRATIRKVLEKYFPEVVTFRDRQDSIMRERAAHRNWDLQPVHPLDDPNLTGCPDYLRRETDSIRKVLGLE